MNHSTRPAEKNRERRGQNFYPDSAADIPALYATDGVPVVEKVAHLHYFFGGLDWYITELDPDTGLAVGFALFSHMPDGAEYGSIYLPEIEETLVRGMFVIERDEHFEPTPLGSIQRLEGHL